MQGLEDRLKELGDNMSRHAPSELRPTARALRRIRVGRAVRSGAVLATVAALAFGGFAGARSLSSDEALPPANPDSKETTETWGGMWPQSSLEEARRAQRLADAGDPRYTWQVFPEWPPFQDGEPKVEPGDVELFTRFLQEELGWDEFSWGVGPERYPPENWPYEFVVVRCAPDETNALYPNDPDGRECAPTIDGNRYETVRIRADQPVREIGGDPSPSGIWVVSGWTMLQPSDAPVTGDDFVRHQIQQVAPPSEAKATEFLRSFLQARVDGEGAKQYLADPDSSLSLPFLYTPTNGAPYERFGLELVRGPAWPSGRMDFKVRLFTEGGATVVEELFIDRRDDGRLVVKTVSTWDAEAEIGYA